MDAMRDALRLRRVVGERAEAGREGAACRAEGAGTDGEAGGVVDVGA